MKKTPPKKKKNNPPRLNSHLCTLTFCAHNVVIIMIEMDPFFSNSLSRRKVYDMTQKLMYSFLPSVIVSMALMKMEVNERFTRNSILLTMYPKEVSSKKTGNEFHCYTPPKK